MLRSSALGAPVVKGRVRRSAEAAYDTACRLLLGPRLYFEWRRPRYPRPNERPVEFAFAFRWLSEIQPGSVLDVGTGKTAWPDLVANCGIRVTAVDEIRGYWSGGFFNRHYHVLHDDITRTRLTGPYDMVTCLSVIEHIDDHEAAFSGMHSLLGPGGHLVLTFPYCETRFVENVYREPGSSATAGGADGRLCRVYSRREVERWLAGSRARIVAQEYWKVFSGELWTLGERLPRPHRVTRDEPHHLTCLLIRKDDPPGSAPGAGRARETAPRA
jgi:SAM-dependent methyltransferase